MKLVTQTDVLGKRFGDSGAVKILAECGFDGIDYSMFAMGEEDTPLITPEYEKYALELKKTAEDCGITFEQSHAPFPPCRDGDREYTEKMMERTRRSIEIAGILDAKICVVHPVAYKEDQMNKNIAMYHELEPYAKQFGVKIALENMWGRRDGSIVPNVCSVADDFNAHLDSLDPEHFTACLDLGHCGLVGDDAANMIRAMGSKRIGCLHIHDNDFLHDSHTLPYLMDMNWDSILTALRETGYSGHFTYEADNFLKGFPDELLPACMRFMSEVGRNMISKIENG